MQLQAKADEEMWEREIKDKTAALQTTKRHFVASRGRRGCAGRGDEAALCGGAGWAEASAATREGCDGG
eukprot:3887294-Prymnesium_polylepis.1